MRSTTISEGIAGLILWDELDDPYDHDQLAANWLAVGGHNHISSEGGGVQIDTDALANNAVTHAKLAPNSVDGSNIIDGSVCTLDIGDGCITVDKLRQELFNLIVPLGTIVMWYRENTNTLPPAGWAICDGSGLAKTINGVVQHDFNANTMALPNLRDRFVMGAGGSVAENTVGGRSTINVAHDHSVQSHHHVFSGSVVDGSHSHSFTLDPTFGDNHLGFMRYLTRDSFQVRTQDIMQGTAGPVIEGVLKVQGFTNRGVETVVVDVPPLTGSTGGGSHSHTYGGITTDTGSSTDSKLGSVDIIPP